MHLGPLLMSDKQREGLFLVEEMVWYGQCGGEVLEGL